jgi:hypothetical protein
MPDTRPVPGHGALIAIEMDTETPGVFSTVAQLVGDIGYGLTRGTTEVSPHNENIDSYVTSIMRREQINMSTNFLYGEDTQMTLRDYMISGEKFGIRLRGPGGLASTDEIIASGFVVSFKQGNPVREGARSAEIMFQPSGPFIMDGELIGAAIND